MLEMINFMNILKSRSIYIAFLLVVVLATNTVADVQEYFVNQSGSGAGNGLDEYNAFSIDQFSSNEIWSDIESRLKIDPGDIVYVCSDINDDIIIPSGGGFNKNITIDFQSKYKFYGTFNFNGNDYITLTNWSIPEGRVADECIIFGSTNNISIGCNVVNGFAIYNDGSEIIKPQYTKYCNISNNKILHKKGNIVAGSVEISNISIKGNVFTTSSESIDYTTDIIKLGWAENVLVKGNKLILQTSKSGGDPHNDILQCWYNYSDKLKKPKNWTIVNNWFEIRSTRGGAFSNFCMFQYMTGNFNILGNIFFSHDLDSTIGSGINLSRHRDNELRINIVNNTFVSINNGFQTQINIKPESSIKFNNKEHIINNLFFRDIETGTPIREGLYFYNEFNTTIDNNSIYGWSSFVEHIDNSTSSRLGSSDHDQIGEFNIKIPDMNNLMENIYEGNFNLQQNHYTVGRGKEINFDFNLINNAKAESFPNPSCTMFSTPIDIGADKFLAINDLQENMPSTPLNFRIQ